MSKERLYNPIKFIFTETIESKYDKDNEIEDFKEEKKFLVN